MILLATVFDSKGWHFKQLKRTGRVALYERWKDTSASSHYEVIIVQNIKESEAFGNHYPAHERYPASEQWGEQAWTYRDEDEARAGVARALPVYLAVVMADVDGLKTNQMP